MDRIIAKLKWEPNTELNELPHHTEYDGKDIYALTRKTDLNNAGYIISYIGQSKSNVIKEIKQHSYKKPVTGFQIVDVKVNGNLNPSRLTLIENALIHYSREIHYWAGMNKNLTDAPNENIRIWNMGHKHPKFHKGFDIIDKEIITK